MLSRLEILHAFERIVAVGPGYGRGLPARLNVVETSMIIFELTTIRRSHLMYAVSRIMSSILLVEGVDCRS